MSKCMHEFMVVQLTQSEQMRPGQVSVLTPDPSSSHDAAMRKKIKTWEISDVYMILRTRIQFSSSCHCVSAKILL